MYLLIHLFSTCTFIFVTTAPAFMFFLMFFLVIFLVILFIFFLFFAIFFFLAVVWFVSMMIWFPFAFVFFLVSPVSYDGYWLFTDDFTNCVAFAFADGMPFVG